MPRLPTPLPYLQMNRHFLHGSRCWGCHSFWFLFWFFTRITYRLLSGLLDSREALAAVILCPSFHTERLDWGCRFSRRFHTGNPFLFTLFQLTHGSHASKWYCFSFCLFVCLMLRIFCWDRSDAMLRLTSHKHLLRDGNVLINIALTLSRALKIVAGKEEHTRSEHY